MIEITNNTQLLDNGPLTRISIWVQRWWREAGSSSGYELL